MKQIDLEPHQHSHLYEMKPMSRWWFAFAVFLCLGAALLSGVDRPETWALIGIGILVGAAGIFCFPRYLLSKIND